MSEFRRGCVVGPLPIWTMDRTLGVAWMEHAVRHGDLALARWLLVVPRARVKGCQTLLDVARERRRELPRDENVEELIQLLMDGES